ncbi:biotin/lipoate A/B protein ligase family protein [Leptolyngbya sp. 'hensonii']|uniref:lipoate--protein ligase family protein n=1 Tax=Leptolyngbya sp. 'hensonii' TaxID=1922337 RepID=UPI00209B5982|nr:biotin/lipoate A/B protein ligase family protein [Leptolyngbya sp. 'hensonii']
MTPVWRFIPLLEADGCTQMAVDHWLFRQHALGHHPPTLRFYTWAPPAISLGRHQQQWPEHWNQLVWQGSPIDLVRRPTGGRAVLHQGDLTYAVITSGLVPDRVQAYRQICEFLIQGWRSLGLTLEYGEAKRGYIHNPHCFGTATQADLVLPDGTKLIGSAQLRQGNTVLQHGSMALQVDPVLMAQVFGQKPTPLPLLSQTATWENLLHQVVTTLTAALEDCFTIKVNVQPLSVEEIEAAITLQNQDRS